MKKRIKRTLTPLVREIVKLKPKVTMKIEVGSNSHRHHNLEVHTQEGSSLHRKDLANEELFLCQEKKRVRIEQTILWSYPRSADKKFRKLVFYRKPLLTQQGSLDRELMMSEILVRKSPYWEM